MNVLRHVGPSFSTSNNIALLYNSSLQSFKMTLTSSILIRNLCRSCAHRINSYINHNRTPTSRIKTNAFVNNHIDDVNLTSRTDTVRNHQYFTTINAIPITKSNLRTNLSFNDSIDCYFNKQFSNGLRNCTGFRNRTYNNSDTIRNYRYFTSGRINYNAKGGAKHKINSRSTLYYLTAIGILTIGLSYAAVPLYRIFCQAYSYGGAVQEGHDTSKVESMSRIKDRIIKIKFNADTAAAMTWNFKPQQTEIKVTPGETALAFYTAKNPTDKPVIGISTYNVLPFDAGQYFNKIQCFCFEEQMLNPYEQVHMPVFFYIDPEFADDPKMQNVDIITLSYTFFEAKDGLQLPVPSFVRT